MGGQRDSRGETGIPRIYPWGGVKAIWTGTAAPPAACCEVRRLMGHQLARSRIASGFERTTSMAAKSGSLLGFLRNEIGVIEDPSGRRFAVAAFTRAQRRYQGEARINNAIGLAARAAVAQVQNLA